MRIKNNLLLIFVVVITILIAASGFCADERIDWRLRLEKGQSYKMEVLQDFKFRQIENGQQKDTSLIINIQYIYDVEDINTEGNAWIKVTYHSIYCKDEDSTGSKAEYDSSNRPNVIPRGLIVFDVLFGKSVSILVSPKGIIKDIRGADAIQKAIIEKIPPKQEGEISFKTNDMIKEQSSGQALREALGENLFAFYPDEQVGVGDTWQKNHTISKNLPPINVQTIYTLKERKDGIAVIDVFSMVQPNLQVEPITIGQGTIQFKFSGNITGITKVNEATGWTIYSQNMSRLRGQAILLHPTAPQGTVVPISLLYTITQKLY